MARAGSDGSTSLLASAVLEGPAGTGNTMLAEALANSCDWRLLKTSVAEWFTRSDGHLGGVSRQTNFFFDSFLAEPAVGLLDEIDALPDRARLEPRDLEWWTSVVTGVLLQIDRVRQWGKPVLLLGASNFFDRLDAALTRPGRLERRITLLPPNTLEEAVALFKHHLQGDLGEEQVREIARLAIGTTPAAIAGWVRSARAEAAK